MNEFKLTASQKKAIEKLSGNVAVCAGAGTGKTCVLVERYIEMIERNLASPPEILAITFTEKAAGEMKFRIVERLKARGLTRAYREIENAYIGTIHSFCSRILKEHPIEAGIDPEFHVIEEDEADILKENVLDRLIETRFSETGVFELLKTYDEDNVRSGIKEIYEKIATLGISLDESLKKKMVFDPEIFTKELCSSLKELGKFDKKAALVREVLPCVEKEMNVSWDAVAEIQALNKRFDRRGKDGKEEVNQVKECFERLTRYQLDVLTEPYKKTFESLLLEFANGYQTEKKALASFDFNDLQLKVLELLSENKSASAAIRSKYQKQFKFIMVDEFQDTNDSQVKLIDLIKNESNLFIVGDAKQSIYGFRGTKPEFFLQKTAEFEKEKSGCQIKLADNFRSRPEVLHFVNHFFHELWEEKNNADFLVPSKQFDLTEPAVEILKIEEGNEKQSVEELRKKEARALAARIRELVDSGKFQYRDVALLFRATTQVYIYEREFRNYQIPYYLLDGRGFYHQPEIKDLMNFLTIIENSLKDVPLAAVMRSPMFGVTDDSLFWLSQSVKKKDKYAPLFDAFHFLDQIPEISSEQMQKIKEFKLFLDELICNKNPGVSETIELILSKTHYDLYVLGLPEGKRHFANLRKLIDLARELEEHKNIHLGDFVRYVKGLEAIEVRESEAQVEAAEGNVVKLLTIHKSKGLEFPICILPDLLYPPRRDEERMIFHPNFGIGLKALDPESGEFENTLTFETIQNESDLLHEEEAKRLLYVAMTRAMQKLVLSMVITKKNRENELPGRIQNVIENEKIQSRTIDPVAEKQTFHPKFAPIERKEIKELTQNGSEIPVSKVPEMVSQILNQLQPLELAEFNRIDLPVSAYVAFLRDPEHKEYLASYELGAIPVFSGDLKNEDAPVEDNMISAADFGTVVHRIFEHLLLFPKKKPNLKEFASFFTSRLDEATVQKIIKLSETFVRSDIYLKVSEAKRYFAELPFVLRFERGIIQGSLDLLYETKNGEWVIVDYKTSEITKEGVQEKGESYRAQMELYSLACAEIIGKIPEKAVLYFVKPDETYEIKFDASQAKNLKTKYEQLQKEIIEFRRSLKNKTVEQV